MMTKQPAMPVPQTKYDVVELAGGLDQVTPRLALKPGAARRMSNYECRINGGYTRVLGYERYDGRTSPSSVTYKLLPMPTFLVTPAVGQTLTGVASGSTGTIIAVGSNYVVVTKVLGAGFHPDEMTELSGVVIGKIGPMNVRLPKRTRKQYINAAADVYRALITAVPGSGPTRGVFGAIFYGEFGVYAFRDEVDGSSCRMYKASSSGWTAINPGLEMSYKNGTNAAGPPPDGSVATFGLGVPGSVVCQRIITESGSWIAGTATGRVIMATYATVSGAPFAIGDGTFQPTAYPTQITILPGGSYEFHYANFGGRDTQARIYWCDRTNRSFEFDGTVFAPISVFPVVPSVFNTFTTFDPLDRPTHIMVHQNHLFLAIGSSFFHSGPGEPFTFTAIAGAGEFPTGQEVTGFQILPGAQGSGAMAVMGRNQSKILYGTALAGPEPFDLVNFQSDTGALPGTIQTMDRVYYLDDRGVIDLQTAQNYGNFTASTITRLIQPFIELKRGRASCSTVHRGKNQYRLFFNDGTGLYITISNGKLIGNSTVAFPHVIRCAWSGEDQNGNEHAYLGSRDGFVYEMERGTSFDGEAIDADLLLNWNTMGTPKQRKALRSANLEFSEDTDHVELMFGARFGPEVTAHHQDDESEQISETELDMQWDHFTWGKFYWDGHIVAMDIDVKGTSERVQYVLKSSSDYLETYTITSIITRYFPRRGVR
mgnify:CR=1 FL=1